jgi:hypothetical protein
MRHGTHAEETVLAANNQSTSDLQMPSPLQLSTGLEYNLLNVICNNKNNVRIQVGMAQLRISKYFKQISKIHAYIRAVEL